MTDSKQRALMLKAEHDSLLRQYAAHAQWYIDASDEQLLELEVTREELLEKLHSIHSTLLTKGFKFPVTDYELSPGELTIKPVEVITIRQEPGKPDVRE